MTGDARPFLADGLFGNLHQNFLAFLEKIGDEGQVARLIAAELASAASARTAASAATISISIKTRAACALRVSGSGCRSSHFGSPIHRTVAHRFGSQQGLCLSLGLF